jgi:DNA-binding SARP family transcriptional activator/ABC-type transport system substrate-binding protein
MGIPTAVLASPEMEPARFGVLGPLLAEIEGRPLPLSGRKQEALLALLLLGANRAVSKASLIDGLWGERPPASADHALETHVSRLRRNLGGAASRLRTETSGYRLEVGESEFDLDTFGRLFDDGRAAAAQGDPDDAARLLRDALAVWRGPALAGMEEPFAELERGRLEEVRLTALEERIDADLLRGEAAAIVPELRMLVGEHPFRERLRSQLMLALYRAGRQADALEAYAETRRRFVDELGIEPGAELRELEQAVLRQDPALAGPRRRPATAGGRRLRPSRSPLVFALAAAVLVVVAATLIAIFSAGGSGSRIGPVDADAAIRVSADGRELLKQVSVGAGPARAVAGGGAVWTSNAIDGTVSRIDTRTGNVQTIPVGSRPAGLAFGGGQLWVADGDGRILSQVDGRTGKFVRTVGVGNGPAGVAFGFGSVWVANSVDGTLDRVDPDAGIVSKRIPVGAGPDAVAVGSGAVWVALPASGSVVRVDPVSGDVVDGVTVGNDPETLAANAEGVWAANAQNGTVSRIDAERDSVVWSTSVGARPSGLAADAETVWVAVAGSGQLLQLDGDGRLRRRIELGNAPSAVAVAPDGVWATTLASEETHRGGTLRVAGEPFDCRCIDPAVAVGESEWQLLNLVYDGLVAYRRVGGSAGARLVGDLARAVPQPTPDGRKYVFRLRPHLRYSDGTAVRATDVRRSLERMFVVNGGHPPAFYDRIVGARACARARARCDLSRGVVADNRAGTVTFHLTGADPEFLYKLALSFAFVVPGSSPRTVATSRPLLGTGSYTIERYVAARELRLVRNRRFRVFAPTARPDGFPDRIVARFDAGFVEQIRAVVTGKADVAGGPAQPYSRPFAVDAAHLAQLRTGSAGSMDYFFLNTRVPPFDDVRVRRAVNLAVDRGRLVGITRGSQGAHTTCQILPPGFPGYRPYCPYTVNPSRAGTWTARDVARAERLVARSRTGGMRVLVFSDPARRRASAYFASVLRDLGYRASLRVLGDEAYYKTISDPRGQAQAGPNTWFKDYTSPADFFRPLFSCSALEVEAFTSNISRFCDGGLDRRMARASDLQTSDPAAAGEEWARVDRAIVNSAAVVPYANGLDVTLLSRRVGNYQFNPEWGVLLDQLWVR